MTDWLDTYLGVGACHAAARLSTPAERAAMFVDLARQRAETLANFVAVLDGKELPTPEAVSEVDNGKAEQQNGSGAAELPDTRTPPPASPLRFVCPGCGKVASFTREQFDAGQGVTPWRRACVCGDMMRRLTSQAQTP